MEISVLLFDDFTALDESKNLSATDREVFLLALFI